MDVAERLPAHRFLDASPFVELRFFHAEHDPEQLLFLYGLIEAAVEPSSVDLRRELLHRIETLRDANAEYARKIVGLLVKRDVPAERKLALWGKDMTRFFLMQGLIGKENGRCVQEAVEKIFSVRFRRYEEAETDAEEGVTVFWGRVQGKLAILHKDYSVTSFGVWDCGHLYLKYDSFSRMQQLAADRALSHSEFHSSPLSCSPGHCPALVGGQLSASILETPSEDGATLLAQVLKQQAVATEESGACLLCCGRLKADFVRSKKCGEQCRVCEHCAAISSLRKGKFECPMCGGMYSKEEENRMNSLSVAIAGVSLRAKAEVEDVSELIPLPRQREPPRAPSSEPQKNGERCACGNLPSTSFIYCEGRCHCSACIIKHYILTREMRCPSNQECFGLIQLNIQCSYCTRVFRMSDGDLKKYPCCLCFCGAVLCCFCIQIKEAQEQCPLCNCPVQLLEDVMQIREAQESVDYGCFCGEKEAATVRMPCGHMVHSKCRGDIFFCRVCKKARTEEPAPKMFKDYLMDSK